MKTPVLLWVILFFLLLLHTVSSPLQAAELKTVTFAARDSVWVKHFRLFTDGVEKESRGSIRFRFVGGPEAIPPFEQIDALRRGVVDAALLPGAYFVPHLPEADAMKLSPYLPREERRRGIHRVFRDLMESRLGIVYLGRVTGGVKYHFYLKKPIRKPDLSGLKIRVTPIYEPFVRALKGIPITTAPGEVYIALERGVVDGFGWPSIGILDLGWHEVVKYVVMPGFYQTDVCILLNGKAWERLGEKDRLLLQKVMDEAEAQSHSLAMEMEKAEQQFLLGYGIKAITFSGREGAAYLETAYRSAWERVLQKSPIQGRAIRDLMEAR